MELGARVVEARDTAADIAGLGGVTFGLHGQVADDVDALAGRGVLKGDPGGPDGVDLADGWAVQACHRATGPAQEDVAECARPPLLGARLNIEPALPGGAGPP